MELTAAVNKFIEENRDNIDNPSTDCSELADWLVDYLKNFNIKSKALRIAAENFHPMVTNMKIPYRGDVETFSYHYVVLVNDTIVDVNNLKYDKYSDYKKQVEELNPNLKIIWTEEDV